MDRTILAALLIALAAVASAEEAPKVPLSTARANAKGNELVTEGGFEEAAGLYREEALKFPDNGILHRNLAGALARGGQGDEALGAYGQALRFAGGPAELARTHYDLANTLALAGQAEQAMGEYARALMLDPGDRDAKHNMEFLQRMLQQQEQEQQQEQQEQGDEQQEGQQQQGDDQQDQQEQPQDSPQDSPEQQEQEQEQQQAPPTEEEPMSREDAERLLDAMLEEEEEFQEQRARQEVPERTDVEKDW